LKFDYDSPLSSFVFVSQHLKLVNIGKTIAKTGSEQKSGGTRAGVGFVKTAVSVNWRFGAQRLDQDSGLAWVHGIPAGN
jgi:hypothetical protein